VAHLPGHPRDARGVPRPVRRAPSHERGPEGCLMQPGMEIFFRRLGEAFLPRGIFSLTFIETAEHQKLAGSIGFRFEGTYASTTPRSIARTSPCRPGWCSWPRTSASRSRPGARRSTC
jgi:hypothetical protein